MEVLGFKFEISTKFEASFKGFHIFFCVSHEKNEDVTFFVGMLKTRLKSNENYGHTEALHGSLGADFDC